MHDVVATREASAPNVYSDSCHFFLRGIMSGITVWSISFGVQGSSRAPALAHHQLGSPQSATGGSGDCKAESCAPYCLAETRAEELSTGSVQHIYY
eukprot:6175963-Pleurochrysis_carterae.AAC.1